MHGADASLIFAVALGVGVIVQAFARHIRVPGIVLLLAAGVALGPDGAGWVDPRALGDGLIGLVRLSVAIILFEGGLNLEISRLRREGTAIRRLVTLGAIITGLGAAIAVRILMDWGWTQSLLFGTIVIVTGPTVVTPILRHIRILPRVSTVLEAEGVLIDPIGAFIAVLALEIAVAPSASAFTNAPLWLAGRIGFGLAAGAAFGFLLAKVVQSRRLVPEGYENIVTMGGVVLLFAVCRTILPESGILATTVAGIVVGNMHTRVGRAMSTFEEQITVMLIGLLFVLLAASVRLVDVQALGWGGLATVAALMFIVRPVQVFAMTARAGMSLRDKVFISWLAPRGIVAAAVASLTSSVMEVEGIPGGPELRALVFLTIAITVLVQGGTAPIAARLLRLLAPPRDAAVILSADGLGLAVGGELRASGTRVTFLDSNAAHCNAAERLGYGVVFGNAFDEKVLARARLEQASVAIGLTSNTAANALFAQEARSLFGVPETYVGVDAIDPGVTTEKIERERGLVLFGRPKDLGRWNVRFRHKEAPILHLRYGGGKPIEETAQTEKPKAPLAEGKTEEWLLLALHRDKKTILIGPGTEPQKGDIGAFVLHAPTREQTLKTLAEAGWELPEEKAPA